MTSETFKTLLMIAMFAALELALYLPQIRNLRLWSALRSSAALLWPAAPAHHALVPVRVRRNFRRH